jgi:hypothetical protein
VIVAVVAVVLITNNKSDEPTTTTTESTTKAPKYDPTKYEIQGVNDKGVLVLLGEDGKAIINDQNQIVVVDRDSKGEIIMDENGEPQTHLETIETKYVTKDYVYAVDYTINVTEGWEGFGSGYIVKDGNIESKCQMKCFVLPDVDGKKVTLEEYLADYNVKREKEKASKESQGFTIRYEEKNIEFTDKKIPAIHVIEETRKPDGTLQSYYEKIYFELNGTNYNFQYLCSSEEIYNANKDFNFLDYANKNFIVK